MSLVRITDVTFKAAPAYRVRDGLLGWVLFLVNRSIVIDGAAVRRTSAGRLVLSFPSHRTPSGHRRYFARPLDDRSRRDVERQVFAAIGMTVAP
jgi:hypothetical protein